MFYSFLSMNRRFRVNQCLIGTTSNTYRDIFTGTKVTFGYFLLMGILSYGTKRTDEYARPAADTPLLI
jgi:hypothetical protein